MDEELGLKERGMSIEECLQLHKELWSWRIDYPFKNPAKWPKWKEIKEKYGLSEIVISQGCYCICCLFVGVSDDENECQQCPLDWSYDGFDSPCYHSRFWNNFLRFTRPGHGERRKAKKAIEMATLVMNAPLSEAGRRLVLKSEEGRAGESSIKIDNSER